MPLARSKCLGPPRHRASPSGSRQPARSCTCRKCQWCPACASRCPLRMRRSARPLCNLDLGCACWFMLLLVSVLAPLRQNFHCFLTLALYIGLSTGLSLFIHLFVHFYLPFIVIFYLAVCSPLTLHSPHSTNFIYTSLSTLHLIHVTLHMLHFTIYTHSSHSKLYLHFTPHTPVFIYTSVSALHQLHFTLDTLHFAIDTSFSTLCHLHFTSHTSHFTIYISLSNRHTSLTSPSAFH